MVFDLDGTLIRGRTCCELIAAQIGRLERMRGFERCITKEEIAAARIEMRGWYSRYTESELCASLATAIEAPGLTNGLKRLRAAGVQIAIASITWSFAVGWFARRLGAQFHLGTELRPSGAVVHVWPEDKAVWLSDLATRLGVSRAETSRGGRYDERFANVARGGPRILSGNR